MQSESTIFDFNRLKAAHNKQKPNNIRVVVNIVNAKATSSSLNIKTLNNHQGPVWTKM